MSLLPKAVIFTAPGGWGKTQNAEALRLEFGCTHVHDDEWNPSAPIEPDTLHLTNAHPSTLQHVRGVKVVARGW